ncbi:hypothetical protein [Halomonas piscis]|uniref:hypothetical protein n=1 Tax=Halomonas piscis TaxID=3031727 RepID=UPI0028990AFB|nr:hypothetical protein [Halomonas piscis]
MDVITSEKLVSHWQVEGNQLVKAPSLSDTYWMLDAMLGSSKLPHVSLNAADVKNLAKEFFEYRRTIQKPITQRQARKRVNRLLEQMNTLPNINAVLIPEPILTHRPTALPHSQQSFSSAMQMVELDRHVLKWSRQENTVSAWLTALAIRFMTNLGMGEKVMLGTLSQLTLRHVDKKNKILFIPSSPEALDGDGHYRMILPDDVWVPLRAIVTRLKERPEEAWLFAENESVSSLSVKERRQWLRQHCFSETRQLLNFHRENGKASSACLTTWPKIVKASQHVPVLKGTPSLWSTLLRDYPLPTCTPVPLRLGQSDAHYYAPGNRLGRLPDRQNRRGPAPSRDKALSDSNSAITRPAGVLMVSTEHLPLRNPHEMGNKISMIGLKKPA